MHELPKIFLIPGEWKEIIDSCIISFQASIISLLNMLLNMLGWSRTFADSQTNILLTDEWSCPEVKIAAPDLFMIVSPHLQESERVSALARLRVLLNGVCDSLHVHAQALIACERIHE
jgi:hypothetical protein